MARGISARIMTYSVAVFDSRRRRRRHHSLPNNTSAHCWRRAMLLLMLLLLLSLLVVRSDVCRRGGASQFRRRPLSASLVGNIRHHAVRHRQVKQSGSSDRATERCAWLWRCSVIVYSN